MILLPAIDLYEKKVVRLTRGDYAQMTVYNDDPVAQAKLFQEAGAQWLHTVDLEGAKDGSTPNYSVIEAICKDTSLKVEIGGGGNTATGSSPAAAKPSATVWGWPIR